MIEDRIVALIRKAASNGWLLDDAVAVIRMASVVEAARAVLDEDGLANFTDLRKAVAALDDIDANPGQQKPQSSPRGEGK